MKLNLRSPSFKL